MTAKSHPAAKKLVAGMNLPFVTLCVCVCACVRVCGQPIFSSRNYPFRLAAQLN